MSDILKHIMVIMMINLGSNLFPGTIDIANNKPPVECRLLEECFDLQVLQMEFESVKNYIVARDNYSQLWQGIPLKNALGTVDSRGLQIGISIKRDKMEKCYSTEFLKLMPYISGILEWIEKRFNTDVGLVRIFKLPPSKSLPQHKDGPIFNIHNLIFIMAKYIDCIFQ